jgi:ribonuclease HI
MKLPRNCYLLKMKIINESLDFFTLQISLNKEKNIIKYSPEKDILIIYDNNNLGKLLKTKENQLQKILRTKRKETFFIGFKLNFVLHDEITKNRISSKNYITILDKRIKPEKIYKTDITTNRITKLYTDGSYLEQKNKGGFAVYIKYRTGKNKLYAFKTKAIGNNLIELKAVIKGIQILKKERSIRIITDSRYVIKGATEWIQNWKINNWKTANGERVKNIRSWKKLNKLANYN